MLALLALTTPSPFINFTPTQLITFHDHHELHQGHPLEHISARDCETRHSFRTILWAPSLDLQFYSIPERSKRGPLMNHPDKYSNILIPFSKCSSFAHKRRSCNISQSVSSDREPITLIAILMIDRQRSVSSLNWMTLTSIRPCKLLLQKHTSFVCHSD